MSLAPRPRRWPLSLAPCPWPLARGPLSWVHGPLSLASGPWPPGPCPWLLVPGPLPLAFYPKSLAPCPWPLVLGPLLLAPGTSPLFPKLNPTWGLALALFPCLWPVHGPWPLVPGPLLPKGPMSNSELGMGRLGSSGLSWKKGRGWVAQGPLVLGLWSWV